MGHRAVLISAAALVLAVSCANDDADSVSGNGAGGAITTDISTTTTDPPETAVETVEETSESTTTLTSEPTATTIATTATTTTITTTPPAPPPPASQFAEVTLTRELVADLWEPTGVAWREGDDGLYITIQGGVVHRLEGEELSVVLDISDETTVVEPGSERGLLGIDFDPRDGRMFLNFTGRDNHTRVVSYEVSNGVADPGSRRQVLFFEQPGVGHNGGQLVFDDDGNLFVGSGDGGASNGRDAQDPTKLLGAILRIQPYLDAEGYEIPPDNPFADGAQDLPEVWVRGLRNPWGFSIDRPTGDLWIGDVGLESRESVYVAPAGQGGFNFGWYYFEGFHQRFSEVPDGLTPPVHDYPRNEGVAVMGGYVYRGSEIPELEGAYVFGDLSGPVWAMGANHEVVRLEIEPVRAMVGWGEDPSGELYMLSLYDGVYRVAPA